MKRYIEELNAVVKDDDEQDNYIELKGYSFENLRVNDLALNQYFKEIYELPGGGLRSKSI